MLFDPTAHLLDECARCPARGRGDGAKWATTDGTNQWLCIVLEAVASGLDGHLCVHAESKEKRLPTGAFCTKSMA